MINTYMARFLIENYGLDLVDYNISNKIQSYSLERDLSLQHLPIKE